MIAASIVSAICIFSMYNMCGCVYMHVSHPAPDLGSKSLKMQLVLN